MSITPPLAPRVSELPFGDMQWERFEAFSRDLLSRLGYRECHLFGTRGQKQHGIDLIADYNGERWAFSNKRWRDYNVASVQKHIVETTYEASHYRILLSRIASAEVRNEVRKHPTWDVWDASDLSAKVRELRTNNADAARELIDHHFGTIWRRNFLGLPALAAFRTPNDTFRELLDSKRLFHHAYLLVGRASIVKDLVEFSASTSRVLIITGRGGIGKSRLLLAAAQEVEARDALTAVRFWIEGVPASAAVLDELPIKPCLLIVDDAHRREDLQTVLSYARQHKDLKLILAARPFGLDRIRSSLRNTGFDDREITDIPSLAPLKREEVRELARRAIGPEWSHREDIIDRLTRVTGDCPLVTVIGGQLIAEKKIAPELLEQDNTFRRTVLDRFADERLGHISSVFPVDMTRRVLEYLAAINPLPAFGHEELRRQIGQCVGASSVDINRIVGELEQIGVLMLRGNELFVTPDVFADHLLTVVCLNQNNQPTDFADQVFSTFSGHCPTAVLRNLAELDWRVRSHTNDDPRLLTTLWDKITRQFERGTATERVRILDIVSDATHYQPSQVLMLARIAISNPANANSKDGNWNSDRDALERLPNLLERTLRSKQTQTESIDLLWKIGLMYQGEEHIKSAFKALGQAASYKFYQPLEVNCALASAARKWALSAKAHPFRRDILPIVQPLLAKSATDHWSDGRCFHHRSFLVSPENVRSIRCDIFAILREYLWTGDVPLQLQTLASIQAAINGPMPFNGLSITSKELDAWIPDQLELLSLLADFLSVPRAVVAQLRVLEAIQYQAEHGPEPDVRSRAIEISQLIPDTFEVRLARLLLSRMARHDQWYPRIERDDDDTFHENHHLRHQQSHQKVIEELWVLHPIATTAFAFLNHTVRELQAVEREVDARHVLWYLLDANPSQTIAFTECVLANPESPLADYFSTCLVHVRRIDPAAATNYAREAVESGHSNLAIGAASHYCWNWFESCPFTEADKGLIRLLISSSDLTVRKLGLATLHHLERTDASLAVSLALSAEVGDSVEVAEELASLADLTHPHCLKTLHDHDFEKLLHKFDELPRLDHWICSLAGQLVTTLPEAVVDLFLRRIAKLTNYMNAIDAVPDYDIDQVFQPLADHARHGELIRQVRDSMISAAEYQKTPICALFRAVSIGGGPEGLAALREWLHSGKAVLAEHALRLMDELDSSFVFDQREFVAEVLSSALDFGSDYLEQARATFRVLALNVERSGPAGKPFPQDITLRDRAIETLSCVPPNSEAHKLYDSIRRSAEDRISDEVGEEE